MAIEFFKIMYSQDCYHYRRPDVSNVTWFTPQQVDAIRMEASLQKHHVNSLEERCRRQKLSAEFAEEQAEDINITQLLADAPRIVNAALRDGVVQIHKTPALRPHQIVKAGQGTPRRKWSAARKACYRIRRRGMKYNKI